MAHTATAFPFFVPTTQRSLSDEEVAIMTQLVNNEAPEFSEQVGNLSVVGRCGCGACPTIFFQTHDSSEREREIASYSGKDSSGGVVGVLLWARLGKLSQLEFYSADGHDPWTLPRAVTLERD